MKTSALIAALQAIDPSGKADVFVYHGDTDEDYILTNVSGSALSVMLDVGIACRLCKAESADEDDSWDGFCPSCADQVSEWMDTHPGKDQDDAVRERRSQPPLTLEENQMAHFYGTIHGSRGLASREGTKVSGLVVTAASWEGAITVRLYERDGQDFASISFERWKGSGRDLTIYNGPVNPKDSEIFAAMAVHAKAALNIDGDG